MSKYKRKQSNIISSLKRKNNKLRDDLSEYIRENRNTVTELEVETVKRFNKRIYTCANISLYSQNNATNVVDFLAAHTCKSKTCFVCNFLRQKSIRRKYALWFSNNQLIYELRNKKNGVLKLTTEKQYLEKYSDKYDLLSKQEYDLMHLTLTVPHTEKGFQGEQFYFDKLKNLFHYMRKEREFWNFWVFGGEYGMEATGGRWVAKDRAIKQGLAFTTERTTASGKELVRKVNADGLHIHIHALLLVRRARQSRNKLHREILLAWNKLTIDKNNTREPFSKEVRESIKKGNKLLTEQDIDTLSEKGATMLGLETIFTMDHETGKKVRGGSEFNSDAMKRAVMETISYHFEPLAFEKEDKKIDLELLIELLPKLAGTRLYAKFGCLDGEKSLNVKESGVSLEEDFKEAVQVLIDEDTGELLYDNSYFLCNPALIYHKPRDDDEKDIEIILSNKAKQVKMLLYAHSTGEAVKEMSKIVIDNLKSKRKKEKFIN